MEFISIKKAELARLKTLIAKVGQDKDQTPKKVRVKIVKELIPHAAL